MKVVIVDDHPLVRQGLSSVLSLVEGINLAGEADSINSSIKLIDRVMPDLCLVDLRLSNECGLDLISIINERSIKTKTIVLTSSTDINDFIDAEKLGVDGYVMKEALPEELIYAIKIVLKGRKYYDPVLLEYKMQQNCNDKIFENLTPREQDILKSLGKGLSNKEIAQELFITEYTVKKHVSQVLAKLNLSDRTQAALYANNKGLVTFKCS